MSILENLVNFTDIIQEPKKSLELFGEYINDKREIANLEINVEEMSDKVMLKIDEGVVADFDYTDESLESIDKIIADGFSNVEDGIDEDLLEDLVTNLGTYLALTIIKNIGGKWHFRPEFFNSSIFFEASQFECFPYHRVAKRLVYGKEEALSDFYVLLLEKLGVTV